MKELSIEEKAKRYDEAIKIAKDSYNYPSYPGFIRADVVFPELQESEDERIRKELIAEVKEQIDCIPAPDCRDKEDEKALKQLNKWLAWLEKHGEQKSIDEIAKEVSKDKTSAIVFLKSTGIINEKGELADEYKIEQDEQNPAWSDEDEKQARQIERIVHDDGCTQKLQKQIADWFKSLKDRVRPQNITVTDEELAQAKKDAYNDALDKIEYHSGEPTFDDGWSAAIWYLKKRNAQPQNTWKPSDEQMYNLSEAAHYNCAFFDMEILKGLYDDLKKLMEE